jgi:hypothetical protein
MLFLTRQFAGQIQGGRLRLVVAAAIRQPAQVNDGLAQV